MCLQYSFIWNSNFLPKNKPTSFRCNTALLPSNPFRATHCCWSSPDFSGHGLEGKKSIFWGVMASLQKAVWQNTFVGWGEVCSEISHLCAAQQGSRLSLAIVQWVFYSCGSAQVWLALQEQVPNAFQLSWIKWDGCPTCLRSAPNWLQAAGTHHRDARAGAQLLHPRTSLFDSSSGQCKIINTAGSLHTY